MSFNFLRLFAVTDDTPLGHAALAFCKALCRLGPVRVISTTGGLTGPWAPYAELTMTPADGTYVNCVCTHPSSWVERRSMPMPAQEGASFAAALENDPDKPAPKIDGFAAGVIELYTPKALRNVILVVSPPITAEQEIAPAKYDAVLIDKRLIPGTRFEMLNLVDPTGTDFAGVVAAAVLGPTKAPEGPYR